MYPDTSSPHFRMGAAYEAQGMYEEAIAAYQTGMTLSGENAEDVAAFRGAYEVGGIRGVRRWELDRLKERSSRVHVRALSFAAAYAKLGEKDQAFELLEKAYEQRAHGVVYIKVGQAWDNLRSDPRFGDLLRRMNFPE